MKKKKRKYWVHPLIRNREHSAYVLARELSSDPDKFKGFFRMSKPLFDRLVELVSPQITKKDTNWRLALSAEEKVTITLRQVKTSLLLPNVFYLSNSRKQYVIINIYKCLLVRKGSSSV